MDKTERLPENLLTSVFSVYFCSNKHGASTRFESLRGGTTKQSIRLICKIRRFLLSAN